MPRHPHTTPAPLTLSLLTPDLWRADVARVNWLSGLLHGEDPNFRDLLSLLLNLRTAPSPGTTLDPSYELGRVHGADAVVQTILGLARPAEGHTPQPRMDYGAEQEALRVGALTKPLTPTDDPMADGWEPHPVETTSPLP